MRLVTSSGLVGSVTSQRGQLRVFGELVSHFGIGPWPPRKLDD